MDGTFVKTYSATGLRGANCVAFRADGHFYVASASTGSVVQFDDAGGFVRSFTGYSLSSPMGIAIFKDQLYVAGGGSNNIVVFDQTGSALREIRHADISGPQGIAFRPDGVFAVSSYYSNKVAWFNAGGTHERTVTPSSSRIPRTIGFLPGMTLDTQGGPTLGRSLPMTLRSPFEPGTLYLTALALGTSPGITLPDTRVFPLNQDPLFLVSIEFPGFIGTLDAKGEASVTLFLPKIPWLKGVKIHAAALTADQTLQTLVRQFTGAKNWTL